MTDEKKTTPQVPNAHEAEKQRIADDAERALENQRQLLVQLRKAAEQPDSPEGVRFSEAYADERGTLIRHYLGDAAFPQPPSGKTTAAMGDPYYGQKVEGMFDEYGDNMQRHRQHMREGWVPVIDDDTGEHVQTRGGNYLYSRPVEFRIAQQKAAKEMREAQMAAAAIPNDALKDGSISDGVLFDETTIKRGG